MEEINFETLKELLKSSKDKKVLITFHSIGDTDSVSSAIGLQRFFSNATVATPDYVTGNSKRILERLGFDEHIITNRFDDAAEMIILVDVNNFGDCGFFRQRLESFDGPIVIIDHHTPNRLEKENVSVFNDESYNSAASIVYEILKSEKIVIDRNLANLMAAGILSDSAELRNAFPKTFVQIGELLEKSNKDYQTMLLEMQHIAPTQNRSEFIKDLFQADMKVSEGLLILSGAAHMHANKIADDAIRIGADVAIFYTTREREVSFSARLRPPLDKTYGINLGKIMKSLSTKIKGQGGGHPCAAGAYGPDTSKTEEFMEGFLSEINKKTRK
jgi:nanoRNase/pAp phosphatase (c-di-AMP/oligoRNAs hydrolase)